MLCTCLFLFKVSHVSSQGYIDIVKSYGENYFSLKQHLVDFYDQYDSLKIIKGSGYKDFIRWDLFWQDRIDSSGEFSASNISMTNQLIELINNPEKFKGYSGTQYLWHSIGPDSNDSPEPHAYQGLISSIWVDTNNFTTIMAGSNSGGLFITHDGGDNWTPLTDQIPALAAESIVVNQLNKDVIYISTGVKNSILGNNYSYGVLASKNGGETWDTTGMNKYTFSYQTPSGERYESYKTGDLLMKPTDTNCLYLLVNRKYNSYTNLMRSSDGAITWDSIYALPGILFYDMEFKPEDPGTLYLAGEKIIKLTGDPIQVTDLTPMLELEQGYSIRRIEAAVTDNDPNILYLLCFSTNADTNHYLQLFRSFNGGQSFIEAIFPVFDDNMANSSMMELKISNQSNNIIYTAGLYMYRFTIIDDQAFDDGIDIKYHVDVRDLVLCKGNQNQDYLYLGNDGGITKTEDGGDTFNDISKKGLVNTQFYGFGTLDGSDFIMGGTQDGNKSIYRRKTDTWIVLGVDAYGGIFSPLQSNLVYSRGYYSSDTEPVPIMKSIDNGLHFNFLPSYPNDPVRRNDVPFCIHPDSVNILYIGYHDVYKSADSGTYWTRLTDFTADFEVPAYHKLRVIAISEKDPQILYAGFEEPVNGFANTERKKLFKSTDRGATWQYIDNTKIPGLEWSGITDLKIHPGDENEVWISLSLGSFDDTWKHKVYRTTDGGKNFINISDSLPTIPVNTLEIDRTSPIHDTYIGTDLGVFMTNDTLTSTGRQYWVPFNNGLPYCIVSDLQIDYFTGKLLASTFGRGFWENDCPSANPCVEELSEPLHITSDTTWSNYVRLMRDVIIDSNATLTIKTKTLFHPDASLIVKRGAKLILDGGTLTNACENRPWQGVQVWGDESHSQMEASHFGRTDLLNGACIENAETAITTTRLDDYGFPVEGYNGGIVRCVKSSFRNNTKCVEIFPFTNFHPVYHYEIRYFASFYNCMFEMDNEAYDWTGKAEKESMVKMSQVYGVDFLGCDFKCMMPDSIPLYYHPYGIYSIGSQFNVDEFCLDPHINPCQQLKSSTFYGLDYGIKAFGVDPVKTITVNNAIFTDNLTGIYLSGINNATITRNTFEIAKADTSELKIYGGLYLDFCTGYTIEENSFTEGDLGVRYTAYVFGLVVKDSGEEQNEIYNNIFTQVDVGIEALNHNRGEDLGQGLVIKCNEFNETKYNIVVARVNDTVNPAGIARFQGSGQSVTSPAGNLFWIIPPMMEVWHYINIKDPRCQIFYTMHQPSSNIRVKPVFYTNSTITLDSTNLVFTKALACPSHLSSSGPDPGILKTEMAVMDLKIDSAQAELNIWVDGGNTEQVITDIALSPPPEAYDIYSDLMLKSPYLSDTVMKESIGKEDVLNNTMIEDILVANPQSAKSDKISEALNDKSYPLSEEQRENIDLGRFTASAKEKLEAKLANHIHSKAMIKDDIITIYLNDTVNTWAQDSLGAFLSDVNTLQSNYQLTFLKIKEGDSTSAMTILDNIENTYDLNAVQLAIHQQYENYVQFLASSYPSGAWYNSLDSSKIHQLFELSSQQSFPGIYAVNILQFYDTLVYVEPYVIPDDQLKSGAKAIRPSQSGGLMKDYFKIYPNPALSYIVVEYNLGNERNNDIVIQICDISGKPMAEYRFRGNSGHKIISTKDLNPGIYLCKFVINDNLCQTFKLTITK